MCGWGIGVGKERGHDAIDQMSVVQIALDKGGWISLMHKQAGKVLRLGLKILAPAAQASQVEKQGVGEDPFGVGGMGGGKVEVRVEIHRFEEGRGVSERVEEEVNGERDIQEVDTSVRDCRGKLERRLKA